MPMVRLCASYLKWGIAFLLLWAAFVPSSSWARSAHAAIVNGVPISIEQAPWQVNVRSQIVSENAEISCGGVVLDEAHILTAAHCVFDSSNSQRIPAANMRVLAGTSNIRPPEARTQVVLVASVRVHPYYVEAPNSRSEPDQDDVAVLTLSEPLVLSAGKTQAIGLAPLGSTLPEGTQVNLTGFGEQVANVNAAGPLYSLAMTLDSSRQCGDASDAVFLCASSSGGSSCFGDSGSGLTEGPTPTLVGALSFGLTRPGQSCVAGELHGFASLAAPEIQDFIDGNEAPPKAPRGGSPTLGATPMVGSALPCAPGTWSGEPAYQYTFMDGINAQVLQSGPSSTYTPGQGDVGRTILCQVQATNAGGTGVDRTAASTPVAPGAPTPSFQASTPAAVLVGTKVTVGSGGIALIRLTCKGAQPCAGKLKLLAKRSVRSKGHKQIITRTVTIGNANFAIRAGASVTVKVHLNALGRALLSSAHSGLATRLSITEVSPESETTLTKNDSLRLFTQPKHRRTRKG
jgi:hypothetical protein